MSGGGYDSAKTADEIREGDVDALIDGILTDNKPVANALLAAERAGIEEDAPLRQMLQRAETTHMLRGARQRGHVASMNAATGLSESRSEATGYDRLINAIRPAAQNVLCRGPMGSGKTGTMIEIIRQAYRDAVLDKVRMNTPVRGMSRECLERAAEINDVPSWWLDEEKNEHLGVLYPDVQFAFKISDFLEFAKEPGEKFSLIDEFSSSGNAYVAQQSVESVLAPTMNAFRKSPNGSMRTGYIGHENDTDTAKLVRVSSNVVINKDGKADENKADLATVYKPSNDNAAWENYLSRNPDFKVRGIRDVPESSPWRYHSNYFAHVEWDLDNPSKQIEHGRLRDDWEDYQETDDPSGGEGETYVQCRGTKADGGECGATVTHISGFCHAHRSQWQGDDDPRIVGGD